VSAGIGASAQYRTRAALSMISGAALVDVANLSISVEAGGMYNVHGAVMYEVGTSGGVKWGCSVPALAAAGSYVRMQAISAVGQQALTSGAPHGVALLSAVAALQTVIVSVSAPTINVLQMMEFMAFLNVSTAGSFQIMGGRSVAGATLSVLGGWIRAHRLA
jgi:hypothetical protein